MSERNLTFILAEGPHDAAFLYRILKAHGFSRDEHRKIGEYSKYLGNLILTELRNTTLEELNIQEATRRFLPHYILKKKDTSIIIYVSGGVEKSEPRLNLLKKLKASNAVESSEDEIQAFPEMAISVLYLVDAEAEGIDRRMTKIAKEWEQIFPDQATTNFRPEVLHDVNGLRLGAYIFTQEEGKDGMLEDLIVPMMRDSNEDIFDAADTFLEILPKSQLFGAKLTYDESGNHIKKVNKIKYHHKKSLIGTVGQLQKSGMNNTVCIAQTDYLNDEKIKNNEACRNIASLVEQTVE